MTGGHRGSVLERGIPQAILGAVVGFIFTGLLQATGALPGGLHVTLLGVATAGWLAWGINRLLLRGGEKVATSIYAPAGTTTAYTPTFSHIETLEVRGDLDGASVAWAAACLEHGTNALVRVRAADFHLRQRKDAARAAVLYREARDLGTANDELRRYITQKLADLYLGPLNDEGKAMGELRRLIDAFPDSREAAGAREALASIKLKRQG